MVSLKTIVRKLLSGFKRTAIFAVTSKCNCRCVMCDMYRQVPESISFEKAKKVLDLMAKNGFILAYFTGGEPSLNPDLVEMIRYANKKEMVTSVTTNGTMSFKMLEELNEAGLYVLSVSIDHWNSKICDNIRRYSGIQRKEIELIKKARELGMRVYTLVYLNPYIIGKNIDRMIFYVNRELGVPFSFCYPVVADVNTYNIGGEIRKFDDESLKETAYRIFYLKMKGAMIADAASYIEDIIRFHEGKPPNFYCRGGEYVFYVDWYGDFYPCFLRNKMFNVLDVNDKIKVIRNAKCNDCLLNCFREPSIIASFPSPKFIFKELVYDWHLTIKEVII